MLVRLRDLARELRNPERGRGAYWPIGFAVAMCALFAYLGQWQFQHTHTYSAPDDSFQILARYDAFHYRVNWIHQGTARQLTWVFCQGPEASSLSAGETITWISYNDAGSCLDILGKIGFARGPDGHATLAPNCHEGPHGFVECTPKSTEATF